MPASLRALVAERMGATDLHRLQVNGEFTGHPPARDATLRMIAGHPHIVAPQHLPATGTILVLNQSDEIRELGTLR